MWENGGNAEDQGSPELCVLGAVNEIQTTGEGEATGWVGGGTIPLEDGVKNEERRQIRNTIT